MAEKRQKINTKQKEKEMTKLSTKQLDVLKISFILKT